MGIISIYLEDNGGRRSGLQRRIINKEYIPDRRSFKERRGLEKDRRDGMDRRSEKEKINKTLVQSFPSRRKDVDRREDMERRVSMILG